MIRRFRFKASAELDARVQGAIERAAPDTEGISTGVRPNVWRVIIKSKMTKPAAAACGVLVVAATWYMLAAPGMDTSAYAELVQAVENSRNVNCVHTSEMEYEGEEIDGDWTWIQSTEKAAERWISYRPHWMCTIASTGKVSFYDYPNRRDYYYEPESNELEITYVMPREDDRKIGRFEQFPEGPDVVRSTEEIDGKEVIVFLMESDHDGHVRLWVDPETRLLVQSERVNFVRQWRRVIEYDYPEPAPADIYALGVPRDAKVAKRLPTPEAEQLIENRIKARKALPKSYFSIECKLLESFEGDPPWLQPHYQKDTRLYCGYPDNPEVRTAPAAVVTVTRYEAPNAHIEKYPIWLSESYSEPEQREQLKRIAQAIPTDSLSGLEGWAKNRLPSQLIIFEKERGGCLFHLKLDGTLASVNMGYNDRASTLLMERLNMDFWDLRSPWPKTTERIQSLGQEAGPWGTLIGVSCWRSRVKCYFNPARDYICERILADMNHTFPGRGSKLKDHTRSVLEYARTSSGRWYPRRTRIGWDNASYLLVHHMDDTRAFDDGLFKLDSISADDLAPLELK